MLLWLCNENILCLFCLFEFVKAVIFGVVTGEICGVSACLLPHSHQGSECKYHDYNIVSIQGILEHLHGQWYPLIVPLLTLVQRSLSYARSVDDFDPAS